MIMSKTTVRAVVTKEPKQRSDVGKFINFSSSSIAFTLIMHPSVYSFQCRHVYIQSSKEFISPTAADKPPLLRIRSVLVVQCRIYTDVFLCFELPSKSHRAFLYLCKSTPESQRENGSRNGSTKNTETSSFKQ